MQLARANLAAPRPVPPPADTPPAAVPAASGWLRRVAALAAFAIAMLLLAAPALWNGYPLLQYDTGGYLARWHEGTLVLARSTVYGLFLYWGEGLRFWPVVAAQAAAAAWVIGLVLRCLGVARGPAPVLALLAVLSVATALPWLVGVLITDVFAGLGVLALYLVLFRWAALGRFERIGLTLVLAVAVASHSATLAMLLSLVAAAALVNLLRPVAPWTRLAHALAAIALGAAMLLAANFALVGRLAWTPGGFELAFGRMLQDGIVARYLDDHCAPAGAKADPADAGRLKLCPYRRELPATADEFLWDSAIFDGLGRFDGLRDEMRAIVLGSLADYPLLQLKAALAATAKQLALVETGWGMHDILPHTQGIIERFAPRDAKAMHAARQQRGLIDYGAINRLHVPAAYAASLLVLVLLWRLRRKPDDALGLLAATVVAATLANAGILGILSGPHDRYGARTAWLAVLVALLWGLQALQRRGDGR